MRNYLVITVLLLSFKFSIGSPTVESPLITLPDVISNQEKREFLELRNRSAPNERSSRLGIIASTDQYQFVAWLQLKFKNSSRNCMATLVTSKFLLTARTCLAEHLISGEPPEAIESWFQMTNFKVLPSSRSITAYATHPGEPFPSTKSDECCYYRYDLALLLFESPMSISPVSFLLLNSPWTSSMTAVGFVPSPTTGLPEFFISTQTATSKEKCVQGYSPTLNPNYDPAVYYSFVCVEPFDQKTILGGPVLLANHIIGVQPYEFKGMFLMNQLAYEEIDISWVHSVARNIRVRV